MKHAWWALLVVAGCSSREPGREQPVSGGDTNVDPALLNVSTSELGTERVRPIAKTIEWLPIGTEEGATYADESVVVDRILREDAENDYGVRVRLKNTTKNVVKIQWLLRFYTRHGSQISGYVGGIGGGERWQGAVLEPYGYTTVSDFARIMGADGFRLLIKGPGGSPDGTPDDPATKEERRAKREGRQASK